MSSNLLTSLIASRKRNRIHLVLIDKFNRTLCIYKQCAEYMVRKACLSKCRLDGERARGHVRRVFKDNDIPSADCGDSEPEGLPEGEIPRHDRKHDAQRLECHVALQCLGFNILGLKKLRSRIRVVIAQPCAFFD